MLHFLVVTAPLCWSSEPAAFLEEEIAVRLKNGRTIHGVVDAGSNASELRLRSGTESVRILRTIRRSDIANITQHGDSTLPSAHLPATPTVAQAPPKVRPRIVTMQSLGAILPSTVPAETEAVQRVSSVTIDPRIANWDGDVETDGLLVDIMPLDRFGNRVAALGTVEVELYVPQRRQFDLAPLSGGDTLELVERWSRQIEWTSYGRNGARLQLPFGAIHPELQPDWTASWYGLVHLRFVVPGQGVFEDSRDGVRVRPWAPNRDQLELNSGQRFLPTESLGRRE